MIQSFRSRALAAFWNKGDASRIRPDHVVRLRLRLEALHAARMAADMDIPGFNFHRLHGRPVRYSVHISGPWCLTFEWSGEDAIRLDYEQYH